MSLDLVLRGGRVIDPSQGIDSVMDVGFRDGRVAELGAGLEGELVRDVAGLHRHAGADRSSHACLLGRHVARRRSADSRAWGLHHARRYGQRRAGQLSGLSRACDQAVAGSHHRPSQCVLRRHLWLFQAGDGGRKRRPQAHGADRRGRGGAGKSRHDRGNQGPGRLPRVAEFGNRRRSTSRSRSPKKRACRSWRISTCPRRRSRRCSNA